MKKIVNSVNKRNRDRGKDVEKRVAKILHGERRGILGGADITTDKYNVEVKSRKDISAVKRFEKLKKKKKLVEEIELKRSIIDKWWEQAMRNAGNKEPLLVMHIMHSQRYYVVMSIEQFKKLVGISND